MVSEAHCMSFPCTELLLFNYAKVKTVFRSMAPLNIISSTTKLLGPTAMYITRFLPFKIQ